MFPDGSETAAHNYCRSPDNGTVPWCYTKDTDVRWDYCDVPVCQGICTALTTQGLHFIFNGAFIIQLYNMLTIKPLKSKLADINFVYAF